MQQHSAQHLLSAVLADTFALRTVSFHLGEQDATIDLDVDSRAGQIAAIEQLGQAETQVNHHILSNLPIAVKVVSPSEAQALLAAGAVRKLPARAGDMRLVEIPGLDLNACGGTHVQALGEIGMVLLRETERTRNTLRLHFVAGMRAVNAARRDRAELGAAASALSTNNAGVQSAVRRLQAETRALAKDRLKLREEIAEHHAVQLAVEERIEDGIRVVSRCFAHRDPEYVKLLAMRLLQAVPQTITVLASTIDEPATLVVGSNMAAQNDPAQGCAMILREVLAPLQLRGGGTPELAQAEVPLAHLDSVMKALVQRLAHR